MNLNGNTKIEELWASLAKLAEGRVIDNIKIASGRPEDSKYPLSIRTMQLVSCKALIDAIDSEHRLFVVDELEQNYITAIPAKHRTENSDTIVDDTLDLTK